MKRISIVGAGNVGTTLGLLFSRHGFEIAEICNRTVASSERARELIGQGRVVESLERLSPVDLIMVTTNDNAIERVGEALAKAVDIKPGLVVFHCSGATPASVFCALKARGASVASVHPVKTFTSPVKDADTFAGTWCGIDGDPAGIEVLRPAFTAMGANLFAVDGKNKTLYHTAIVFICNYLFSIIEVGLQCYEAAGVPREVAMKVVNPILHATVENALALGPGKALTGPIARGDDAVVSRQLNALRTMNSDYETLYRQLGLVAATLSLEKGVAAGEKIEAIRSMLRQDQ
jgi:predicted short-subunit dehydrogenase-like oxidoreductase (DUF2520 family)